ncbi:hypothetical protein C8R45DRAFT_611794 [Mycena sanguinolenta]|nr:hypothetical protein C8R45DRAFT_611794 [Mycena sanguinolenta]
MRTTSLFALLNAGAAIAAPLMHKRATTTSVALPPGESLTTIDPVGEAQAQQRDNTATRAFSAAALKTSDGQCLQVIPGTGDSRNNLVPVNIAPCDGSDEQQWDVITAGVHNNAPGTALFVSSLIQGCLNFDPRRAAGNQVILFSCGGRADGGGSSTNSQQFTFDGTSTTIPLAPTNQAGTCLFNNNGKLDQQSCTVSSPSAGQLFTIDGGASAASPPAATTAATATTADLAVASPVTTASVALPPGESLTTIDPVGEAQAQQRDNTATRAFSAAALKTSNGQCLQVIPGTGDSRNNLVPVNIASCDGSAEQQWDVITAGVHNNAPGTALFVSSLIQGCLNFDPRRAAGNQVILFSCGGRADGGGSSTNSQQFTFDGTSTTIPLAPTNQAGTCLFNNNGKLDQQSCTVSSPSAGQLFTIDGGASAASPPATTAAATTTEAATTTTAATTAAASPATTASAALPPGESLTTIDPVGEAQAQQRDNTATRAFSAAALKTSDGQCLQVIPGTGDSRNNLVPVNIAPCDGSDEQQWDVITAGVHNNAPGTALFVSSLIQGCLNFDPRRAAGNQVILFSCGGRADGGGSSTNSQQFTFDGTSTTIPLAPTNQAGTCLFNNNGKLDQQTCTVSSPSAGQLFTISP